MKKINGEIVLKTNKAIWIQFNPYEIIGTEPTKFTIMDLFLHEVVKLNNCYMKIVDIGGTGLFGKDSYSWIWVKMKEIKYKLRNPHDFYIKIKAKNPNEKYGGVHFGGWTDDIKECIINEFPKRLVGDDVDNMYSNKGLKIMSIEKTNINTGEKTSEPIKDEYNSTLNEIK